MSTAEWEDPDFRVHAAWLAQVSGPSTKLLSEKAPQVATDSQSTSTRLVALDREVRPGRRLGLARISVLGCTVVTVVAALIKFSPYVDLYKGWAQPPKQAAGGLSAESLTANPVEPSRSGTPRLVAEGSQGASGEPAPLRLTLEGSASDAMILIKGLKPGMEISTGAAVGPDAWELGPRDLPYAWIAPPQGFTGSTELVAELRLPNAQIADRQKLHVEWAGSSGGDHRKSEREQILSPQEETPPASASAAVQRAEQQDVITPPLSVQHGHAYQGYSKTVRSLPRSSRRAASDGNRRPPFPTADVGTSTVAGRGFWDWSR